MSRITTKLLTPGTAYTGKAPGLDLGYGGQFGYAPNYAQYMNNQKYMPSNARAVLLTPPKIFTKLPNSRAWLRGIKALIETQPKSITGFDFGLTLGTAKHAIGAGGQQQGDPTKTTRAESSPSFGYTLKATRPEQRLLQAWIKMIDDPDTTYSSTLTMDINQETFLVEDYAAIILVFEPDRQFKYVDKAAIVYNFYPLGTGPITMQSAPDAEPAPVDIDISWEGIADPCMGAEALAQSYIDNISFKGANPCNRKSIITGVDSRVAAIRDVGYAAQVEDVKRSQL